MRLRIEHRTTYHYAQKVRLQPHRLMLFARGNHDIRIIEMSLRCHPEAHIHWTEDVFGNVVATTNFSTSTSILSITAITYVEHTMQLWPIFHIAPHAHSYPFQYSKEEILDLGSFMQAQNTDQNDVFMSFIKKYNAVLPTDTLTLLKNINTSLSENIVYQAREEEGTQTPLETLSEGRGSCRDIATLFIAAVRYLGFGARIVSGYLFAPDAPDNQNGTTHAWAEVYLPEAGWIPFDPTHGTVGSAGLIAVAKGRTNAQVMPITGKYSGNGSDFLTMEVSVTITPD